MAQYIATASWLGRFFSRVKQLCLEEHCLVVAFNDASSQSFSLSDFRSFSLLKPRLFSAKLQLADAANTRISFLHKADAAALNQAINQAVALLLEEKITNAKLLLKQVALDEYLRDSNIPRLHNEVFALSASYQQNSHVWQQYLSPSSIKFLAVLATAADKDTAIAQLRTKFERQQLKQHNEFFNNVESNPLTKEQRLAVIRNNDKNLVLAAAGTGKTSVMIAKVLHLVATKQATAEQILLLAYNKTAAEELKTRFKQRAEQANLACQPPAIFTFHALGLQLLQQVNQRCEVSPLATDHAALTRWLTQWLTEQMCTAPAFLQRFITLLDKPINTANSPRNAAQLVASLTQSGQLKHEVDKYIKCLQAIRAEQLTNSDIAQRISHAKHPNQRAATQLLCAIHRAYQAELSAQQQLDFDDMILRATQAVAKRQVKVPWRYILVDEFQDISTARMALLNSLINQGPQVRFTAVGDDWQAIYRFSGGNLALTTRFNELVGSHSLTVLQKTFRYNNSISDVAGRFVMQNPEQYKKHITTQHQVDAPQVILLDNLVDGKKSLALKTQHTISIIQSQHKHASIAVLSRYRYTLNLLQQHFATQAKATNVTFLTLHSAKGLEADYCIIVGLEQGKFGFPSSQQTDPLLESLLPRQDSFADSEERRLFYVGLTRAKYKAYLIADAQQPSVFVKELLQDNYAIDIASNAFNSAK